MSSMGFRNATVEGLKELKSPEEGGSKQAFDVFVRTLKKHVAVTWEDGHDLEEMLEWLEKPDISKPKRLSEDERKDEDLVDEYKYEMGEYRKRTKNLDTNAKALFSLVFEELSDQTKGKVEGSVGHTESIRDKDLVWLLETLENIMVGFEEGVTTDAIALDQQNKRVANLYQKPEESVIDFVKRFKKEVKIYEKHGGIFLWGKKQNSLFEALMDSKRGERTAAKLPDMTDDEEKAEKKIIKKSMKENILAQAMLVRADKKRFGDLVRDMGNDFLHGIDKYPESVAELVKVLENYKQPFKKSEQNAGRGRSPTPTNSGERTRAVQFAQSAGSGDANRTIYRRGKNNSFFANIICRLCGVNGHYQSDCPDCKDETGAQIVRTTTGQE